MESLEKTKRSYKKCMLYLEKQISKGVWNPGERIPSTPIIAETLGLSIPTVRKAIKILENKKILDNCGSYGYVIKCREMTEEFLKDPTKAYIKEAKLNLVIAAFLSNGGILIGNRAFKRIGAIIESISLINGKKVSASIKELEDCINKPVQLEDILGSNKKAYLLRKFNKEKNIKDIARIIFNNKEKFGL